MKKPIWDHFNNRYSFFIIRYSLPLRGISFQQYQYEFQSLADP